MNNNDAPVTKKIALKMIEYDADDNIVAISDVSATIINSKEELVALLTGIQVVQEMPSEAPEMDMSIN